MGKHITPEDKTSYSTQYQKAFLKYVHNEYCAKHGGVPVNKPESLQSNNLIPSAMDSESGQSFIHPYDVSSNDEKYLTPNDVAEMTPG